MRRINVPHITLELYANSSTYFSNYLLQIVSLG